MEITINIPDAITFESRGESFTFEIAKVAEDKRADFAALVFMAGICKAGVDAASSAAKHAEENGIEVSAATREMIEKRLNVWYRGEWSSRGVGEDAETVEAKSILRGFIAKGGDAKKYKNSSPEARTEMVNTAWNNLPEAERESYLKTARARLARKAEEAKRKAEEAEELAALQVKVKV